MAQITVIRTIEVTVEYDEDVYNEDDVNAIVDEQLPPSFSDVGDPFFNVLSFKTTKKS